MGCCLSDHHHDQPHCQSSSRREPPPASPLEEETVKEVLLETPLVPIPKAMDGGIKAMPPKVESQPVVAPPVINSTHNSVEKEIVSEVSEMCSYNESFSKATTTERKDEDEDEDDGMVNQRPPVKRRRGPGPNGGRGRGDSWVQSRSSSPDRRGQVAPLRPSRGRPMAGHPRNVAGRKDPGEGSFRRSRSPVRHHDNDIMHVSEDKSVATNPDKPACDEVVVGEEAESLENPVVSLECFIFL